MTVAIYARVSDAKLTETGERRQDIQRQIDRLRPYAGRKPLIFRDDDRSAWHEAPVNRPEFHRLMREIRANRVQKVYVEILDRWSRDVVVGLTTLREAAEHHCTITSILEGEIDVTSTEGWFRANVALLLAEWASRVQSDKVKSGLDRRRNDRRKLCRSCGVVHMGRHPKACRCRKCRRRK